jgi:GNAT superfamily N-acetyltransferase
MSYRLRPLTPADIPQLRQINPRFMAHTVLKVDRMGPLPFAGWALREVPLEVPFDKGAAYDFDSIEQQNIRERLEAGGNLIEVLEDPTQGRLLGIVDVAREHWRNTGWIWNLMLDESLRGQGWGRQLFERALAWARREKLRALMLETQSNNTPACHFYARLGFQLVGVNTLFYTNQDIALDEVALFWAYPL